MSTPLLVLYLLVSAVSTVSAQTPDSLELPIVRLEITPEHLTQLEVNPWLNDTVPAAVQVGEVAYDVAVRFRGGTSRDSPKKSWRVVFENADNPFGVRKVNLRSEYRDRTMMRNRLGHDLLAWLGYPVPEIRYINLFVNDEYAGIYAEIERVDEDFLTQRQRPAGPLYKIDHGGAHFSPLLFGRDYPLAWEAVSQPDYSDIQRLVNRLTYWTYDDFATGIEELVDVDNVLSYFATQFVVANQDAFQQNFIVHRSPSTGRYEIIPWDMDGSFGNTFDGRYEPALEKMGDFGSVHSTLLMRLLQYEKWRNQFYDTIRRLVTDGFEFVALESVALEALLAHDIAQDPTQPEGEPSFGAAVEQLREFLIRRRDFLLENDLPEIIPLSDLHVSNPFPTAANPHVLVRVRSERWQFLQLMIVTDLVLNGLETTYRKRYYQLYDDGLHDDGAAGDGLFAVKIDVSDQVGRHIPIAIRGASFYPQSAIFYTMTVPVGGFVLNATLAAPPAFDRIEMTSVERVGSELYLHLKNPTGTAIDLSYAYLQGSAYFDRFIFPPGTKIAAGEGLVVTTNSTIAARHYGVASVIGDVAFSARTGDRLRLLSPTQELMATLIVRDVTHRTDQVGKVVINEINYHPRADLDAGEWVELYNPGDVSLGISNWHFSDDDDGHVFRFPDGTNIPSKDFLVVSADTSLLRTHFPHVRNVAGNFTFNLSNSSDAVRIFDSWGALVDSVFYSDAAPWPKPADGGGATLERKDPGADGVLPESWVTSLRAGGTPGRPNGPQTGRAETAVLINEMNVSSTAALRVGDWIELHNPLDVGVQLTGWQISDANDNSFVFPPGTAIGPRGYAVVARDTAAFRAHFPGVEIVGAALGFGLDKLGDRVLLWDAVQLVSDSVTYDTTSPWPNLTTQDDRTLERVRLSTGKQGRVWEHWAASTVAGGTPGRRNSVFEHDGALPEALGQNYPNPFRGETAVRVELGRPGELTLSVYDLLGRRVARLAEGHYEADSYVVHWNARDVAAGIYFFVLELDGRIIARRKAVHLR